MQVIFVEIANQSGMWLELRLPPQPPPGTPQPIATQSPAIPYATPAPNPPPTARTRMRTEF
ncbi:MAG: hypothetical protein HC767_00245 [Akkermansiaceae bacterium]|nr:hypothetical protein [Akkermansiaceae bacterium]